MNADAFRHFYAYHFAENRKIWDEHVMPLSQEQYTRHVPYSQGSVRNQFVHMVSVDNAWFSDLRGIENPVMLNPEDFNDRAALRAEWDKVEQMMRDYLANLRDEMLTEKPLKNEEDKDLLTWQVLLHVANHGTDHRAQVLRVLHDLGANTKGQDYVFYMYDHPL